MVEIRNGNFEGLVHPITGPVNVGMLVMNADTGRIINFEQNHVGFKMNYVVAILEKNICVSRKGVS